MGNSKKNAFESSLSQLEQLIDRMEDGDLSLEESLQAFETGVKLTRQCQQALRDAEQKVEVLMRQNGELVAEDMGGATDEPLDADSAADEAAS